MNLVFAILFAAVVVGLFARRITWREWSFLLLWSLLVISYTFLRG